MMTIVRILVPVLLACSATVALGGDRVAATLADAAERNDQAAIRELLDSTIDVNQSQVDGMTALHWAVYHDATEIVALLVAAGADVKVANRYGVTPLALACQNGNEEVVRLLLDKGADPDAALHGGERPLMTAARTGRIGPVKALLDHGANVNAKEKHGQTAIMWAAADGHAEVVQALIDAGADFKTPQPSGFTPLLFAVREGRIETVRVFLKAGADVGEAIEPTKKPPHRAAPAGTTPLTIAVENGHFELALELVKAGAEPNDQRSGFAPLHMISWVRKPNRGDDEDGDPSPAGSGSVTSLQFVREMVARGADVNLRLKRGASGRGILTRRGSTPFLMACVTADLPLMRTLVELGADPTIPNSENATPLLAAAGVGTRAPGEEAGTEPEVIEALTSLIELGADVNAVDDNGETAMHGAAYKSLPKAVEFLASHGAKIDVWNRKNEYGWTPLLIAEGYRVGNFKPSEETIVAIHDVLRKSGITPPPRTARESQPLRKGYEP